MQVKDF